MKKLVFLALLIAALGGSLCAQTPNGGYSSPASGSSTSGATGPVINVATQFGLSSGNTAAANNTSLTNAFTSANSATTTGLVLGPRVAPQIVQGNGAGVTSFTLNANVFPGDTAYVFITDSVNRTFTVTDDSTTNVYAKIGSSVTNGGSGTIQMFRTGIGAAAQASIITVSQGGAAEEMGATVIVLPNVLSDTPGTGTTGSSTAPSVSQTTTAANSYVIGACEWWNNASITLAANTGTLLTTLGATTQLLGEGMITTAAGASGSNVTNAGTLSATSPWACASVEVKSGGTTRAYPTVYIPYGFYYYSGGINPTIPMKIICEQGAYLYYTGAAHAADIGPAGLNIAVQGQRRYIIDGCTFTGGSTMTQGVFLQTAVEDVGIRNSHFYNFGTATSNMIAMNGENWDVEIGPQNFFLVDDYQPRKLITTNLAGTATGSSFVRFHDNVAWCLPAYQAVGCTVAQSSVAMTFDGSQNRVYHNNLAFWNPAVRFNCIASTICAQNQLDQNQIEVPADGGTANMVQFGGTQIGMLVTQNAGNMHGSTGGFIGPVSGSDVLTGARVNFNTLAVMPTATPVIKLNNIGGQTGNGSLTNNCSTAFTPMANCVLAHTAGASITAWNTLADDQLQSAVIANSGAACTNGELALSAGWQSTGSATVTAVNGLGQSCSWTITTGTTTAANPTVTDTLVVPLPTATTSCELNIHGGTHTAVAGESFQQTTLSATAPVFTANFTPTAAGTTYFVTRRCGP